MSAVTPASPTAGAPHIATWDSRTRSWRPWCEVYGEQWMPKDPATAPTNEVCAPCFALAVAEIEAGAPLEEFLD